MAKGTDDDAAKGGKTPDAQGDDDGAESQDGPATLQEWLDEHDEGGDVKALIEADTANLKSALHKERSTNKDLSKKLREAAKGADDETKKKLEGLADERDAAILRADFYAQAVAVGCTNVDAAYHIARGEGLLESGRVDIEQVKAKVPELFGPTARKGVTKAGQGAGGKPATVPSMNQLIREAAGRTS